LPAPGTTSALAERPVLPVFLPPPAPKDATPWAILSWGSALLHGVSRSPCPGSLDRGHLSWGFVAPSTLEEERVHVPLRLPGPGSLVVPGGAPTGPTPPTTVPLAGFSNLSAACSSPRRPAIFRRVAFVGFGPSGSCSFHEAPTTHRRRHALLTFFPSD
jgi:hypothetical protein